MTAEKKAYYETRHAFRPEVGHVYENEGGGSFRCIDLFNFFFNDAVMQNVKSGWTFVAHGVGIYEDGRIDWEYSSGGSFDAGWSVAKIAAELKTAGSTGTNSTGGRFVEVQG